MLHWIFTEKINKHSWFDFERTQEWPNAYCNSPAVRITKVKYFKKLSEKLGSELNMKELEKIKED